jgi:hypothetical protein
VRGGWLGGAARGQPADGCDGGLAGRRDRPGTTLARPCAALHTEQRRIARVVLLSAACGIHLVDGDLEAAVDVGRSADREATELGVERELPLVRSLLALALLARGEVDEATDRARAAVSAAATLSYHFPLATALETAALVATTRGAAADEVSPWLATAAEIRRVGDRPVPAPLAPQVEALIAVLPPAGPLPVADAVARALGSSA